MDYSSFLPEVSAFLAHPKVSMAETTFGRLAVNDGKFVERLRNGALCRPETVEKARKFMRQACPEFFRRSKKKRRGGSSRGTAAQARAA